MTTPRKVRIGLAASLVVLLVCAVTVVALKAAGVGKTHIVAYFDNSNGIFAGDDVMVVGVPIGKIDKIEPEPLRAKITFHINDKYKVPTNASAIIVSPTLVTARAIQLTPAYTGGPEMHSGAVIPQQRTAVPIEFDDLRKQLEKLTEMLQPTQPGAVSTLGSLVNTAADNLRGQGANIHQALVELSEALSTLGDHSHDLFGTLKNVSVLVSALRSSTDLMRHLNENLAAVTGLLVNDTDEVGNAVADLNVALGDVQSFVSENREPLGTTSDKLASVSRALVESLDDIKQTLHTAPTSFQNYVNIYEPAHASFTGALAFNNFADPIQFICSAVQAASRLNAEQSAKLCVQYLAPIVKNRQYNFLPLGENFFDESQARPNEVTFSEDWLRPLTEAGRVRDYYEGPLASQSPPPPPEAGPTQPAQEAGAPPAGAPTATYPAEATPTDPAAGLSGIMVSPGGLS